MAYEWDPAKNRANFAKHGVDFADGVAVFEDSLALTRPAIDARGERRFVTLGMDGFGRHLVVVHAERGANIRLISARLATKRERSDYED
ncbi:MAG: BrnT family toxin [Casimicrobiaceae bacterium]